MENKRVGVGFGVLIEQNGKILLGKRHEDPNKADSVFRAANVWTMPGGKLDFGEDLKESNCLGCDVCLPSEKNKEEVIVRELPKNNIKKIDLVYNQELFEELRELRKELAKREHVPSFIIFSDAALQEMACYLPTNQESFACINGVGAKKLEQFGTIFLNVINNFIQKSG